MNDIKDFVIKNGVLTEYTGNDTEVIIPDGVTSIGEYAFYRCRGLTSVTIPDSVTSIGEYAFYKVNNIVYQGSATGSPWGAKSVNGYVDGYFVYKDSSKQKLLGCSSAATGDITILDSVTSIGEDAFYNCTGLTSVNIKSIDAWCKISFGNPEANPLYYAHNLYLNDELVTELEIPSTVTSIGNYAFSECTGLTSVTIPNSVKSIGEYAFSGCTGLTSVAIPDSVTSIGDYAFYACTGLTNVTIPDSVTSISDDAFFGCKNLTSITIPDSVTSIGMRAFRYCTSLKSITIPDSVKSIGDSAFSDCIRLKNVTIPDSVTSISNYAFDHCEYLTSITIPNSVTNIGYSAFRGCKRLKNVTIPDSVTSIGSWAFYGTSIYNNFSNWHNNVLYIGKYLIVAKETLSGVYDIKNDTICVADSAFKNCERLISVVIPNSVTSISSGAFEGCKSLTNVTIPNSVTSIGDWAFYGCKDLIVHAPAGSNAEQYAKENNIPFVAE